MGNDLRAVLLELDGTGANLELLHLERVHVGGDAAVRSDCGLDEHVLSTGLARGLQKRDALAGDRVLDCLSTANHDFLLWLVWGCVV
jgi:hypothetical protein